MRPVLSLRAVGPLVRLILVLSVLAAAACSTSGPPAPGAMAPATAAAASRWPIPPGVKTIAVDGYPVAYAEAGTGETIVLLHGALVDHRLWWRQIESLSRTHRVIAPSLRHHWPEPWDGRGEAFSVRRQAADVAGLIRGLGLGRVHLVGHSNGGIVALEVARSNPRLLRTLTLADPAGPWSLAGEEAARQRRASALQGAQRIRAALDQGIDQRTVAQNMWTSMAGPGSWERVPANIQQMLVDNVGTVAAPPDPDPPGLDCAEVSAWPFPVGVIHGANSMPYYRQISAALRRCRADIAEPISVPSAGHNMFVDNPAAFDAALRTLIGAR
jgi:esterase